MLDPIEQGFAALDLRYDRQIAAGRAVLADFDTVLEHLREDADIRRGLLADFVAQVSELTLEA
jgi:hypothetical protein